MKKTYMKKTYKIIRFYKRMNHPRNGEVIETGLTLKEAREHCNDPKTRKEGQWFDGYDEE